jgi:hypothetical protein
LLLPIPTYLFAAEILFPTQVKSNCLRQPV